MRGRDRAGVPFGMKLQIASTLPSTLLATNEPALLVEKPGKSHLFIQEMSEEMGVDLEADKLTDNLSKHVERLTNKLTEANSIIDASFGEANGTLDATVDHVRKISDAFSKLKAKLGGQTNNPPPGDLPT